MRRVIALSHHLKKCSNVLTLGVYPNFCTYSPEEREMILTAPIIYYPTSFYADLLDTLGKKTFPNYQTYKFTQDKIKQSALFKLAGIPHPKTKVFFGSRQHQTIGQSFDYPFIAKIPRGSALGKGVFLIRSPQDLFIYLKTNRVAYIQEYLPCEKDIRIVIVGKRILLAYWRVGRPGEFRNNVSQGATIHFDPIPEEALALALKTASICSWDDVGLDILIHKDRFYVVEANMNYGREGFAQAGLDYYHLLEQLIAAETI